MTMPFVSADRYDPKEVPWYLGHVLEPSRKFFRAIQISTASSLKPLFEDHSVKIDVWTTLNSKNSLKITRSTRFRRNKQHKVWRHFFRIISIRRNNQHVHTTHGWVSIVGNVRCEWFLVNFYCSQWFRHRFLHKNTQNEVSTRKLLKFELLEKIF